jgi:hypothetical protein
MEDTAGVVDYLVVGLVLDMMVWEVLVVVEASGCKPVVLDCA